jgi:hypothetical protein
LRSAKAIVHGYSQIAGYSVDQLHRAAGSASAEVDGSAQKDMRSGVEHSVTSKLFVESGR